MISVSSATEGRARPVELTATSSGSTLLDARLELGTEATRADVLKAIKGHVLAEGRLMGKYARGAKD